RVENQIYVLADGKVMKAYASNMAVNIIVEVKDHIRSFHEYFFSLDPDNQQIKNNIGKALYLADDSAKKAYDNLNEQGYYTKIISSNTSQIITVQDIQLNLERQPYSFRCRSEEHTSELQSRENLVCRLLLEKKKEVRNL